MKGNWKYLLRLAVALAALHVAAAQAQDYPARPVRIVIAFTAGGPNDFVMLYEPQDLEVATGTPQAFGDYIREEIAKWRNVVAAAKVQLQ